MRGSADEKQVPWQALAVVGCGLLLFLFAASGGIAIAGIPLKIVSNSWKLAFSAVGLALMAVGVLLFADQRTPAAKRPLHGPAVNAADCQISMIRPRRYQRRMRIEGGYLNAPPTGALRLFTVTEDGRFRPQSIAKVDEINRRWSGAVDLGPGPYYSVYVVAAFVDAGGRALWDYYYKVGKASNWEPVDGPFAEYAVECGRFLVEGLINE